MLEWFVGRKICRSTDWHGQLKSVYPSKNQKGTLNLKGTTALYVRLSFIHTAKLEKLMDV